MLKKIIIKYTFNANKNLKIIKTEFEACLRLN